MAYIAGPAIREGTPLDPWVRQRAALPYVELPLERATPREFSEQILGRIRDALSVIAVILPNDPSTPIECAFAVREGKRVLIVHQEGCGFRDCLQDYPALNAGIRGIWATARVRANQHILGTQISGSAEAAAPR